MRGELRRAGIVHEHVDGAAKIERDLRKTSAILILAHITLGCDCPDPKCQAPCGGPVRLLRAWSIIDNDIGTARRELHRTGTAIARTPHRHDTGSESGRTEEGEKIEYG